MNSYSRRTIRQLVRLSVFLILAFPAALFSQIVPLRLSAPARQQVSSGQAFQVQLNANGGTAPYNWSFSGAQLPAGLRIDASSGLVSGALKTAGEFRIPVTVEDSGDPAQQATATMIIKVVSALEVRWLQKPRTGNGGISGSVEAENNSGSTLQLTVLVVAVNSIGKAFALGYQHFDLGNSARSPRVPFGSTLPYGSYVIQVDAVGESPTESRIYRSRLSTERLVVQQP